MSSFSDSFAVCHSRSSVCVEHAYISKFSVKSG